jgi:hypothetical protein
MLEQLLKFIPQGMLWAGYAFLGLLFIGVLYTLLDSPNTLGNLFAEEEKRGHHLARYILAFGTLTLALKFLVGVLTACSIQQIKDAGQLIGGLDVKDAAGGSGVAYLLAKVTDGKILTLFGRRRL